MNKIKKLKQLERIHSTLIQENQTLIQELELKKQFNLSNLLLNMMDGVELSSFSSSSSSSSITDELPRYRTYEESIENHKILEETFWRWISKTSKDHEEVESFNSFSSDVELLTWKSHLYEMLKSFEFEVIDGVFKSKVDLSKAENKVSMFNNSHDGFRENYISPVSQNIMVEMLPSFSKELLFPMVDEQLMSLRENNQLVMSSMVKLANENSPYHCIVRENPQTF
jgi:hypothetical protein